MVSTPDAATSSPPDWDNVPFDVGCARCGHDLRGRTDPTCPACGLEFDWADAVPIKRLTCSKCDYHLYGLRDTRCPECGTPFTWDEALEEYHRRQKPLFEYWWRRRPVRTLLRSYWLSIRPWKLWRRIDIQDPLGIAGLWLLLEDVPMPVGGLMAALVLTRYPALRF